MLDINDLLSLKMPSSAIQANNYISPVTESQLLRGFVLWYIYTRDTYASHAHVSNTYAWHIDNQVTNDVHYRENKTSRNLSKFYLPKSSKENFTKSFFSTKHSHYTVSVQVYTSRAHKHANMKVCCKCPCCTLTTKLTYPTLQHTVTYS